jgi:hypothetical protein
MIMTFDESRFRVNLEDGAKGIKVSVTAEHNSDTITIKDTQDGRIEPVKGHLGLKALSLYMKTRDDIQREGFPLYQKRVTGGEKE